MIPPTTFLFYGAFAAGKSTCAATFDGSKRPCFVAVFDGPGKATPYLKRGDEFKQGVTNDGIPFRQVFRQGNLVHEVHYFYDENPEKPDSFAFFRRAVRDFDPTKWGAFILDSLTSMALASYLEQRFSINPDSDKYDDKKSLKWRGGMTDQVEMQVMRRFMSYPTHDCNTVLICHSAEDRTAQISREGLTTRPNRIELDEDMLRGIAAPGRLAKAHGLGSQYSEVWHFETEGTGKNRRYMARIRSNELWLASTQRDDLPDIIDDPCYEAYFEE